MLRIVLGFVIAVSLCSSGQAAGVTEVLTVGPSWDTFTNEDGTGLYHEVLREVFGLYGVTVRHEYVPSIRADELVLSGGADMMLCDDAAEPPLVLGRYPLYANDYFVLYNEARIGPWQGGETLREKEVVCQRGYYHDWDFPVPVNIRSMSSGKQCLRMIILGRSDFYVDDMNFIKESMAHCDTPFSREGYAIQRIGTRSYHPLFNKSERGQAVMKIYNDGIIRLHNQGKLKPIFEKWGHVYPGYDLF